jgi:hypothetical protein
MNPRRESRVAPRFHIMHALLRSVAPLRTSPSSLLLRATLSTAAKEIPIRGVARMVNLKVAGEPDAIKVRGGRAADAAAALTTTTTRRPRTSSPRLTRP